MSYGRKTGGRTKGTPNRTTAAVREAIHEAFERAGGVDYLVRIAEEHPEVFCRLIARLVPSQIHADVESVSLLDLVIRSREMENALDESNDAA